MQLAVERLTVNFNCGICSPLKGWYHNTIVEPFIDRDSRAFIDRDSRAFIDRDNRAFIDRDSRAFIDISKLLLLSPALFSELDQVFHHYSFNSVLDSDPQPVEAMSSAATRYR